MSWMWTLGTPIIRHFKTFTVKWLSMNVDFVELFCFHFDICKLYCLRRPHEDQRRLKSWNCKANISKLTIMTKKTFEYFDDGLEINKGPNMLNRRVNARKAHTLQFFVIGNFIVRPWGRNFGKIVRNRRPPDNFELLSKYRTSSGTFETRSYRNQKMVRIKKVDSTRSLKWRKCGK